MIEQKVIRFRGVSCHVPALTLDAMAALEPDAVQLPINATRVPDFERDVSRSPTHAASPSSP